MNFDHQNIPPGIRLPNGAIVISSKLADDCVVYLGLLADDKVTPFATWIARDGDPESTTHGHYHRTLDEALTDYNNREQGKSARLNSDEKTKYSLKIIIAKGDPDGR